MRTISLITPPATAPVTIAEAKQHILVQLPDGDPGDVEIGRFIDAATNVLEGYANRVFIERTFDMVFDEVEGGAIELWSAPISSVIGVFTTSTAGVETEVDAGAYLASPSSGRVVLRSGHSWPSPRQQVDGLRVRYTAGYGPSPDDLPAAFRQAVFIQVAEWFDNRGDDPDIGTSGAGNAMTASLVLGEQARQVIRDAKLKRYIL